MCLKLCQSPNQRLFLASQLKIIIFHNSKGERRSGCGDDDELYSPPPPSISRRDEEAVRAILSQAQYSVGGAGIGGAGGAGHVMRMAVAGAENVLRQAPMANKMASGLPPGMKKNRQ